MEIELPYNWNPRKDQMPFFKYMQNGGKRAVVVAHRRWGKDDVSLHYTATALMQRVGNYWHMLPKYEQARKVIWSAVNPFTSKKRIDEAFPLEIRKRTLENEMKIEFKNGSVWQLVGSDNYNQYVGSAPIGIVMSEYSISNPMAWAYISPILEQNGGWAIFIYTPRGNNHGKKLYDMAKINDEWFAGLITAEQSSVFSAKQLQNRKTEYFDLFGEEHGTALFEQEYLCSFMSAQLGAYYGKQIKLAKDDGRIGSVPYQPQMEVNTYWDLGMDDSMSIWFIQHIGKCHHVIDYYSSSGMGLEHYAKELKKRGYNYGCHYMPHDAAVREMSSGEVAKTRKEIAEDLGIRPIEIVKCARNMDIIINVHIPAVRNVLATCYFDDVKCWHGIAGLEAYHAEYDEAKKILSNRPAHDINSHPADSFRTFAIGYAVPIKAKTAEELLYG